MSYIVVVLKPLVEEWEDLVERHFIFNQAAKTAARYTGQLCFPTKGPGGEVWGFHPCDTTEPLPRRGSEIIYGQYHIRFYFRRPNFVLNPGPPKPPAVPKRERKSEAPRFSEF